MRFGVKALSRGLHKIGSKVSKPLNKLGSKHTLKTIGNIAHKAGEIGAVVSTVAPEVGMPLMALSAAAQKGSQAALNATGLSLNTLDVSRCYIAPINRSNGGSATSGGMFYNHMTKEVTWRGGKPFVIDHPIREDYKLIHCCIEGPQIDLIYRGKIKLKDGYGEINIDEKNGMTNGTFEALCRDIQSFTTNETGWEPVRSKVVGNILHIQCKDKESEDTISWMVIGERKDKGLIRDKKTDDEGKLITEQPNIVAGNWRSNC